MAALFEARFNPADTPLDRTALIAGARDVQVIVSSITDRMDAELIAALPESVRLIAQFGNGFGSTSIAFDFDNNGTINDASTSRTETLSGNAQAGLRIDGTINGNVPIVIGGRPPAVIDSISVSADSSSARSGWSVRGGADGSSADASRPSPARYVALGYLGYMLAGWVLLALPMSQALPLPALDSLFIAVSAVSTTGLATVDPGTSFTFFGQVVILGLVQIGGFGIMSGASLLFLAVAGRIRLRGRLLAQAEIQQVTRAYESVEPNTSGKGNKFGLNNDSLLPLGNFIRDLLDSLDRASVFPEPEGLLAAIAENITGETAEDQTQGRRFSEFMKEILALDLGNSR